MFQEIRAMYYTLGVINIPPIWHSFLPWRISWWSWTYGASCPNFTHFACVRISIRHLAAKFSIIRWTPSMRSSFIILRGIWPIFSIGRVDQIFSPFNSLALLINFPVIYVRLIVTVVSTIFSLWELAKRWNYWNWTLEFAHNMRSFKNVQWVFIFMFPHWLAYCVTLGA